MVEVDEEICRGCRRCEVVCSWNKNLRNGDKGLVNPRYSGIKVDSDEENGVYVPLVCNHCSSLDCLAVCDEGALKLNDEDMVVVIEEVCSGCGDCAEVCDYIWVSHGSEVAVKCNLCGDEDPACVDACKHDVLRCI